jgi:CDP-paratose 2-epimerase
MKSIYITGIGGLVGSAVAERALGLGYRVSGSESDARGRWFAGGSVGWRVTELEAKGVEVFRRDFRVRPEEAVKGADVIVHCASQPSHDLSKEQPVEDSALNFMGTVELLDAARLYAPGAVFVFLSTNKVYGDRVNKFRYRQVGDRLELDEAGTGLTPWFGVSEEMSLDASLHTPFGASKAAADLMVQEYRRCYGLQTVSLRCGCLTGPTGSAVELHGFLGYLVKCAMRGNPYTIYGYGGYQVRDNLCASDLAQAILTYAENPKGAVYNMGGGRANSISVLEALKYLKKLGHSMPTLHGPQRLGDHKWWVSDLRRFQGDYPGWKPETDVYETIDSIAQRYQE